MEGGGCVSKKKSAGITAPAALGNELIRASAGTGKTYSLVQRYLRLLEHDVEPERIAAMTFTRKAAGEFFERILQELAARSSRPDGARALELLRKVVRRMDRLRLSTIDSFFVSMIQSLPFELGLTGTNGLMGDEDFSQARDEVLDVLMLSITRLEDRAVLDELREAWKDASHGHEQARPTEALSSWCGRLHNLYIECSDATRWGGLEAIWPDRPAPVADREQIQAAVERLRDVLDLERFDKRAQKKWDEFFLGAVAPVEAGSLSPATVYMLKEERGKHAALRQGEVDWMMWKVAVLSAAQGSALADVLDALVWQVVQGHSRRSLAQSRVMKLYEASYHRHVRGRGRLVFSDLAWLLSGRLGGGATGSWQALREAAAFRMDARYDHWLLDEFQDTSERQWEVLVPLLEEARQDAAQQRSVFLVGDLKQSIYLWRQAEPELFHHVERTWAGERLAISPLNNSQRSCPQVLDMVNATFAEAQPELESLFPGVSALWHFENHLPAEKVARLSGHAAFLHIPAAEEGAEDVDALTESVASIISEINPLQRGLSCAVLVRRNDTARVMSEALRSRLGMEIICESEEMVLVDNPATLALLSLVQLSVHPSDTKAWHHLGMTPLADMPDWAQLSPGLLSARLRRDIAASGFLPVLREWVQSLRQAMPTVDAFTERRLVQLLDFAATFDETGSRDADDFLRRARSFTVREDASGASAIQVLTVHKSKGLQFDIAILPELQGEALDSVSRNRLFVSRAPLQGVKWILDKPDKHVIGYDPVLSAELKREKARAAFEGICCLYVSMTRAKLALYVVTAERSRNVARNESDLLRKRLGLAGPVPYELGDLECGCFWESGERQWYTAWPLRAPARTQVPWRGGGPGLGILLRSVNASVQRRAPSGEESFRLTGRDFSSTTREAKRQLGLRVHELVAAVPWLEPGMDVRKVWQGRGLDLDDTASSQVLALFEDPSIRPWFTRADSSSREVWVERRVDAVLDGEWVSGILDRVVLERDAQGRWTSATILDFKTDEVPDDAAVRERAGGYRPQMELYRKAVQKLTGLPKARIRVILIFTSIRRLWPLD